MAPPALATTRLLLRPLALADADAVQAHFPRWEIVRFLSKNVPWPYPPDGARTFIAELALPAMRAGREWHWSIRAKADPARLLGALSLQDKPDNHRGLWLDPAVQGRGLMAEAVAAVTDYWFDVLGRPVLRVPKAVANEPSRRISERSGMRLIRTEEQDFVCGRLLADIWEITREEWQARRSNAAFCQAPVDAGPA